METETIMIFGWISTVCFGISPLFLAEKVRSQGHCHYLSGMFIWPWLIGEIAAIAHTAINFGFVLATWPVYLNYLTNLIALATILTYWFFPRRS